MTAATASPAVKVPPQNIEAEESVLGAAMVSEPALRAIVDAGREPQDFYLPRHGLIFEAILALNADGKPVDSLTVADALERRGELEEVGGKHFLSELAAKVPAVGNAAHYAEIVGDLARQRVKIAVGQELTNGLTPTEGIERLRRLERRAGSGAVRRADLSRVKPVQWVWRNRILVGYLSLLLGAEGIGKGTLIASVIARLTRGELPGDLEGQPAGVLLIGDEDSFDAVVVPRLHAAGADLDMVDTLDESGGESLDIGRDAERLRALVLDHGYKLIFLDALLDTLGVDVDDWRSKAVREALRPIRRIAGEVEVGILASLHPNKGQRSSFRDLVSGSHAFNASSRSSLLLAAHPDDRDRRVLVRGKGNLSAAPPAFEFAIAGCGLNINGHDFSLPVVTDEGDTDLSIEDVVKPQREAPVRSNLAEEIDAVGTFAPQRRADIAKALGRPSDDRSVGRALDQLEDQGRWSKLGRGVWQKVRIGIGTSSEAPMSKDPEIEGLEVSG